MIYIQCISVLDIISQNDCKSMSRPGGYTLFQGLDYRTCFCIRGIKRKDIIDYQTSLTSSSRTAVQPEGQERYLRMIKKTERRVEASIKELQIINQPNRKNMYHTKPHSQIEAISCHILTSHDIPKAFLTPRPLMIS
jgi:hypothetical protein